MSSQPSLAGSRQRRRPLVSTVFLSLLFFSGVALAQVSCANVTIANAAEADVVRKNCREIEGRLMLAYELAQSINLDGVEVIRGDVYHSGCEITGVPCIIPPMFTISSSTLQYIGGNFDVWWFQGLEKLLFPKLHTIMGGLTLKRTHNLTTLEIPNLSRVGGVLLECPALTNLTHNGIESFTKDVGGVTFWSAAVDSVDSFFRNPLNMSDRNKWIGSWVVLDSNDLPNVKKATFGWSYVEVVEVRGDIRLTLGGPNTTEMHIGELSLTRRVPDVERASTLQKLSVGTVDLDRVSSVALPFDDVDEVLVNSDALESFVLPPQAANWKNLTLKVAGRNLSLGPESDWTWPTGDMWSLSIVAKLNSEFFASFFETRNPNDVNSTTRPRVLGKVYLEGLAGSNFTCAPFDELQRQGVLPKQYNCDNLTSSDKSAAGVGRSGMAAASSLWVTYGILTASALVFAW